MTVTVVIGLQWGDEAKGKMVDILCQDADIVARYNGGDNAGHTVVNSYGTFKLRLVPNGIANPKTQCVIGPGVVVNLDTLLGELEYIHSKGIQLSERFWLSPRCHVVMPYHPMLEEVYENAKGSARTGTTGRGMGPVYADKVSYNGIRLADLAHPQVFKEKLRIQLEVKNTLFRACAMPPLDLETIYQEKLSAYARLQHMVREPFGLVQEALQRGANLLLEGAQGALLDNDWGTYPFCYCLHHRCGRRFRRPGYCPARSSAGWLAWRKPIPAGWAADLCPPSCWMRPGKPSAMKARNTAPSPGGRGAAAGWMQSWCTLPPS